MEKVTLDARWLFPRIQVNKTMDLVLAREMSRVKMHLKSNKEAEGKQTGCQLHQRKLKGFLQQLHPHR